MTNHERSHLDTWFIDAEFSVGHIITDDESLDLVDRFSKYSMVTQTSTETKELGLSLAVEAASYADAFTKFQDFTVQLNEHLDGSEVVEVTIMTEAQKDAELDKPFMPDVVGLNEVAELAGVTRQRANRIVKNQSFPQAVLELAAGKLWWKPAVQHWIDNWDRKVGRPAKALASA